MADTERTRAAIHEAGHALVAASRGQPVDWIEIRDDGTGMARHASAPPRIDELWALHGGHIAEAIVWGRAEPRGGPPEQDDRARAYQVAQSLQIRNVDIMNQVRGLLEGRRAGLEHVASRLLEGGALQGDELATLLQEALTM
jgi:hypothetical protein